ncbi:MAG: IS4 family transposase [Burkholderiales bacterium]|nr:IS4 family transposase [Burkholderiales bacterium]
MYSGKLVFAQLMDHLPLHTFRRCVARYPGKYPPLKFSHLDQFLCMAFAQLTFRESLRDIVTCLNAHQAKLYHLGIRGSVARSTLADANEKRDFRIFHDFALSLIATTRGLYRSDGFGVELDHTAYALDSTTIDLSLSLFPWAHFQSTKAAIKLHTLLDLRGNIPSFIHVSDGKFSDLKGFDQLLFEPGSFYIMDRGYIDFARLFALHSAQAFFVTRARSNQSLRRVYSRPIDKATGLRCDQTIRLTGVHARLDYPLQLRRVKFYDEASDQQLVFLSNNFTLPALSIARLYRCRWQVELFFKWIKQHLRIKAFFGTSENAVKTQIWIAIAVYVLVALVKKRLRADASLYTILQILSLTLFEKTPLDQLVTMADLNPGAAGLDNQLKLFD